MFLKLRPENIFIQNCTTFSRIEIYNINGKQQDSKRRKRKPGKRCLVMCCNKINADGVSPHQFPADESVQRQQIAFVRTKREPNGWTPVSGHICSDHFSVNNYERFHAKIAGIKEVRSSFYSSVSYSRMLHNASGFCLQFFLCNSLQIFLFHYTYFYYDSQYNISLSEI